MRNDEHNDKVHVAYRILKSLCLKYDFTFINYFRINDSSLFYDNKHLKRQSGLDHLSLTSNQETSSLHEEISFSWEISMAE